MTADDGDPRLSIARVTEADFDRLITGAGGQRRHADAAVQAPPNADYELGDAILELKLIEEEGLRGRQKGDRQGRLTELFRRSHPDQPVVVLDPAGLDPELERRYFKQSRGKTSVACRPPLCQRAGRRSRLAIEPAAKADQGPSRLSARPDAKGTLVLSALWP